MTPPSRRALLLGAASTVGMGWVQQAFAMGPEAREQELFAAWHRARRAGRDLFVLVVPVTNDAMWERGRLLGATLNHGDDLALAALATVELVCASREELDRLGVVTPRDHWFALIGTDAVPAPVTSARPRPMTGPIDSARTQVQQELDFDVFGAEDDLHLDRWISAIEDAWIGLLLQDRDRLARRVAQERRLAPQAVAHVQSTGADAESWAVQAAPATLAEHAMRRVGPTRTRRVAGLAEWSRARFATQRVPGSHWALNGPCGVRVEGADELWGVRCGMGHVPLKASRMLYFFDPG